MPLAGDDEHQPVAARMGGQHEADQGAMGPLGGQAVEIEPRVRFRWSDGEALR